MNEASLASSHVFFEAELRALGEAVMGACPIDERAGEATISRLVETEMFGIASHGFHQLPRYARMLRSRAIDGQTAPEVLRDHGAFVVIDARHGMGQYATTIAMEIAEGKAAEFGFCVLSVRHSNHFGAAFPYCAHLAEAGYVAFLVTNAPPNMAPWGGVDRTIGNNPFSWGIPRRVGPPVVLDIACSVAAGSRLTLTGTAKGDLPAGWALDEAGEVTTNPSSVYSYLPIGGHKGYGIALINEVLAGVLTGSLFGLDLPPRASLSETSWDVGHLLIVLDPEVLRGRDEFLAGVDRLAAMVRQSRLRGGFEEVLLPGEKEYRTRQRHLASGVPLPAPLVDELSGYAGR